MGTELTVAFLLQQWLRERPTLFCYRHITHLIFLIWWSCLRGCRAIKNTYFHYGNNWVTSGTTWMALTSCTGYEVQLLQPNLRHSLHCVLSSSTLFFTLFIPHVECLIFVVSALRDHPLLHCCFDLSWRSDESGWSRMTGESAFSTSLLLLRTLSAQSSSACH